MSSVENVLAAAAPLDYAKRPRHHWIRRHTRLLLVTLSLICLGVAVYLYRVPVGRFVAWHYWHWQLSRHQMVPIPRVTTAPADHPIFQSLTPALAPPTALVKLLAMDSMVKAMVDDMPFGRSGPKYNYIGQRRRPDGQWRTVVIANISDEMTQPFYEVSIAVLGRPSLLEVPPDPKRMYPGRISARSGRYWPAIVYLSDDATDETAIVMELQRHSYMGEVNGPSVFALGKLTDSDQLVWSLTSVDAEFHPWLGNGKPLGRNPAIMKSQSKRSPF